MSFNWPLTCSTTVRRHKIARPHFVDNTYNTNRCYIYFRIAHGVVAALLVPVKLAPGLNRERVAQIQPQIKEKRSVWHLQFFNICGNFILKLVLSTHIRNKIRALRG